MRLRQLVLACGLASLSLSSYVSALGLGEVKLKSTLNQPLQAEVRLLDTRDLTAEQILVTLASPADFERNGVDRLFFYTEFQFTVDLDSPDGPKVLITSRNPVREPYLNFLIEARWTAGRLLREYTLLMDLPTFEDSGSRAAVQSAPTSGAQTQQPARQATAPSPATSYAPSPRTSSGSTGASPRASISGDSYEVRNNDTLWEVALKARPDSSITVHQSMMALYKANPDAFIGGNINRLRRGQVLRIPDAAEMKSLGRSEAVSQFAATSGDAALGAQINASRRTNAVRTESTEVSGRVKLAAPSTGSGSGQGSGANDGSGKALESELAATLEELDKSKAENTELSSRVRDLEAQIDTMQRLVDVSNEKMRALQIAAEQKNSETPATPQADAATPVVDSQPEVPVADRQSTTPVIEQPAPIESAEESSVAASSEPAVAAPQPAPEPAKVITRPKPEPSLVDKAVENAPWIGLGVLGLAGAGYLVYRRRKQQEEEQEFEQEDVFAIDETPATEVDEQQEVSNSFNEIHEESLFEEEQPASAVAETGDVVGEADIYIAYGKLDQAEEMLLNALKKDPESTDIRMKLLEVYSQQQNAAGFDRHYAALLPIAGAALLARATELRAGISDAGEFDSGAVAPVDHSSDEFTLDDFSLDDLDTAGAEAPATTYEPGDFDFSLDLDDEPSASTSTLFAESNADDFSLDLEGDAVKEVDDLSELSLALDGLEADDLPDDVDAATTALEDDFNFDLDDDLSLDDELLLDGDLALDDDVLADAAPEAAPVAEQRSESLDVNADDFNLDMNVDDIDLAALDHEMESLDVDFDDEAFETDSASISEFAAQEIAKDKAEFGLDLDEDMQLEDLSPSNLKLTDDLDKNSETVSFDLGDINSDLNVTADELATTDDDFDFNVNDLDANDEALAELDLSTAFDDSQSEADLSGERVDLELDDEIPGTGETAFASSDTSEGADQHDEDLFSQALSEFSSESDDLDLNEFSSDEAVLANLSDDEMDSELDFLADADEAATKLDLARAYIDMGDTEGAKDILSEVINEGNDDQRKEAGELLGRIV